MLAALRSGSACPQTQRGHHGYPRTGDLIKALDNVYLQSPNSAEGASLKEEVSEAIQHGIEARRQVLGGLSHAEQTLLLEYLFIDFFAHQHLTLQRWAALTGQSAQVDTGYIAQFIASIVLQEPGQGFRGKGDDLADGSEVKSAANISGVDRPRWNHNLGTPNEDRSRRRKEELTKWEEYLLSPHVFYLLVDRVVSSETSPPHPIRIRSWCIDGRRDTAWRGLVNHFVEERKSSQYNLQLHPPVGYDDSIVVNTLGNLDYSEVLIFDARIERKQDDTTPIVSWNCPLTTPVLPIQGRSRAIPYGGRGDRPSLLTDATDLVADVAVIPSLFPGVFERDEERRLTETLHAETGEK